MRPCSPASGASWSGADLPSRLRRWLLAPPAVALGLGLEQQAHADQAAVTLGNANSEIGGLTISAAYDQSEVQALRDKCEELADDVRALSTLLHRIRTDLIAFGAIKGSA